MNFLAYAMGSGGAGGQGGSFGAFVPLILMFAIFYFLLIRPQQKKAKKHRELLESIQKGDQVMTGAGIFGTVNKVFDNKNYILLEIADKTVIKILKSQVGEVIKSKGEKATETESK